MAKVWNEAAVMRCTEPGKHALGGGLYLRVQGASKSYVFRWQVNRKPREKSLGPIHKLRLAEARAIAAQYSADIFHRKEPGQTPPESITFEVAAKQALSAILAGRAANTKADWQRTVDKASKAFGKTPVADITTVQVRDFISQFWVDKPARAEKHKTRLARIFEHAIAMGQRDRNAGNPAAHAALRPLLPQIEREETVHRASLPYKQAPAAVQKLIRDRLGDDDARGLLLVAFTVCRAGNALQAQWEEFDLKARTWNIPKIKMKSRRPFVIPLSTRAVELLKRIGPKDAGPVLDSTYLDLITALRDASGDRKATTHGLRTTFATWAERHNVRDSIIEGCLDHIDTNKTRASYRGKSPLEERRAALEAWGLYLVPPVRTERTIRRGDWVSAA